MQIQQSTACWPLDGSRARNQHIIKEALQKLLRSPSALARARASLAYLPDMSRDSLRGFAHLGLLATLLQSFLKQALRLFAPERLNHTKIVLRET